MLEIFKQFAHKSDFELTEDAEDKLSFIFDKLHEKRNRTFGNARVVRNIFEECVERQANRIVSIAPITTEILRTLTEADIPEMQEAIDMALVFGDAEQRRAEKEQAQPAVNPADMLKMMGNFMPPANTTEQPQTEQPTEQPKTEQTIEKETPPTEKPQTEQPKEKETPPTEKPEKRRPYLTTTAVFSYTNISNAMEIKYEFATLLFAQKTQKNVSALSGRADLF
jgi:hypothetical protein